MEMTGAIARGHVIANGGIKGKEAGGVALFGEKIAKAGGDGDGVIGFGFAAHGFGGETHGAAEIDEEVAAEVGFVFEFFEVVAIGAAVAFPIDVADVVTGGVLAVF